MKKINIAELLKDCPKGMELDCTMFENVSFRGIQNGTSQIMIHTPDGIQFLNSFGCYHDSYRAKCVIFPKGKTTWEGINIPFKDGDIVSTDDGIFTAIVGKVISLGVEDLYDHNEEYDTYCHIYYEEDDDKSYFIADATPLRFDRLANEEEKERLFQAIKDNGYKWNTETKTLEELIIPRFKVGDKIKHKSEDAIGRIEKIGDNVYHVDYSFDGGIVYVGLKSQDDYELVPNKFDISSLIPFESRVLFRNTGEDIWKPAIFGCYLKDKSAPYYALGGTCWRYCIPFDANEHLLGKTDDCSIFYKTWE